MKWLHQFERHEEIQVGDDKRTTATTLMYLGSIFDSNGGAERDINNGVKCAGMQGRRSGYESGGGRHTCQPREKFWRDKRVATERSEPTSEGGSGGPSPENFKNLHGKWCNLRYSLAIFVNIISLYCNKTCINYASFITI